MKGNQKHLNCFNLLMPFLKRVMKEWPREKQKNAKHELETVQKEKRKITNELEEKVVKKAKSK